jgi:Flp pilus assembly protein TadG
MSFLRDERGNILVVAGFVTPLLFGVGAFVIDLGSAYRTKGALQNAADAAALAAALSLPDAAKATTAALDLSAKNTPSDFGQTTKPADVVFGTYDKNTKVFTPSATNINAVRVYAKRTAAHGNASPTYFARVIGASAPDLEAYATAARVGPPACVIAMSPSGNGLSVAGSGKFSVPNCAVWVNSSASNAATAGNGATASALKFCVVGSYSGQGSFSPTPQTGCTAIADPLSNLPEPSPGACIWNYNNNGLNANVWPGTYCGSFTVNGGGVTLQPGNYYFQNVTVSISSNASLSGSGVFLFLDAGSSFSHTASGSMNLSAPTSGTYAGVVIFHSRQSYKKSNKITGSPDFILDGTIYMPTHDLTLGGTGTINNVAKAGYVIADTFTYNGSSTFTFDSYTGVVAPGMANKAVLVD